ncbi:phage uncharacterized protein (putative large terminase), C-terminal domain-containing protein [Chryseobacterium sp. RU37D]|nr:phage uncharacterized protein (putative large terminase), C-terminal domain-containing protein [Chryseobacterium sp. RU37D]
MDSEGFIKTKYEELLFECRHINLNISPGTTKSTIISRMFSAWCFVIDPTLFILVTTRASKNAEAFADKTNDILRSESFIKIYGNILAKDSTRTVIKTNKGGQRHTYTTLSKENTGKHFNIIIFDDIQAFTDLVNLGELKATNSGIDAYLTRVKSKTSYILINCMQRLGMADATDYLFHGKYYEEPKFSENQYEDIILPAQLTEDVRPKELAEFYVNDLFDPIRMSSAVLVNEKRKAGNKFDPQFLQKAVASQDEIMYYDGVTMTSELNDNYEATFSFTDLKDTGEDSYASLILGIKQGKAYVIDVVYNKNSLHDNESKLVQKTKDYKTSQNYVESNSNQSYIDNDLTYKIFNLKPRYQSNNKLERIKSVRHIFKFLHWFENHPNPEYQEAIAHIKQFPFSPHKNYDDGIEDVATYALDFLQGHYPFIVTDVSFNVGNKN